MKKAHSWSILAMLMVALFLSSCAGPRHEANVGGDFTNPGSGATTAKAPAPEKQPAAEQPAQPKPEKKDMAKISTKFGDIIVELDAESAPKTVANFKKLVTEGFYNGTTFHRIIPSFMIQGGDPKSKDPSARSEHGTGGPGYTIPAEIKISHTRGAIAMARLGDAVNPKRDSSGSQFFICVVDCQHLDGQYTAFGHVTTGMEVVDQIVSQKRDARDNPLEPITMTVTLVEDK